MNKMWEKDNWAIDLRLSEEFYKQILSLSYFLIMGTRNNSEEKKLMPAK